MGNAKHLIKRGNPRGDLRAERFPGTIKSQVQAETKK